MKKNILNLTFILVLISGCGGGGGSSKLPNYAGAWSGGVSLIDNSCARAIPSEFQYISTLHNVEQGVFYSEAGDPLIDIVLNDGRDTYTGIGEVDQNGDGHHFTVTGSPHELPGFLSGYTCIEIIDFDYNSIDLANDSTGYLARHSSITCTRGNSIKTCDVTYTGSAYRNGVG